MGCHVIFFCGAKFGAVFYRRTPCQAKKFVTVGSLFTLNLWQEIQLSNEQTLVVKGIQGMVILAPGARVRPSTNHWVSYQPTIGYLTDRWLCFRVSFYGFGFRVLVLGFVF